MNEHLTSRVNRLINGSLNSFVETLEKMAPEMVMQEAISEVNSVVAEVRVELGRVIAKKHLTQSDITEDEFQHKLLSDKIAIALESQREDLVEVGIAKQLEFEAQKLDLKSVLKNCSQQEQELQTHLMALEEKQRGMSEELSRLVLSQQGHGNYKYKQGVTIEDRIYNAESTFNRLLEKHTRLDCGSLVPDKSAALQLAKLEELSKQNAIQKRLTQLKDQNE